MGCLDLQGGCDAGPLFNQPVRRPKRLRPSGGRATWNKYKRAMPKWADRAAIRAKWKESRRMTAETGIQHSVDHIVPLAHPLVCGLHVEWNLRVVDLDANKSKSNRYWPDMPGEQIPLQLDQVFA